MTILTGIQGKKLGPQVVKRQPNFPHFIKVMGRRIMILFFIGSLTGPDGYIYTYIYIQACIIIAIAYTYCEVYCKYYMDVSENSGTPKSSILIGFSIIFTIHFGGPPLFLETPVICKRPERDTSTQVLQL